MIELATLDDTKKALNIWENDDDEILALYLKAASKAVTNYLKGQVFKVIGDIGPDGQPIGLVPEEVQLATIMMVGFVYRDPDGNDSKEWDRGYLPRPVTALLYPLRDPAINGLTTLPGYGLANGDIIIESGVEEAPLDGQPYVRQDGAWVVATATGISEPPDDGKAYARRTGDWVEGSFGKAFEYNYNSNTVDPPSNGQFRMNNADPALATLIRISDITSDNIDLRNFLPMIRIGASVIIQDKNVATIFHKWTILSFDLTSGANVEVSHAEGAGVFGSSQAHLVWMGWG
jgi:Phage gp6-like head-tail connector protein